MPLREQFCLGITGANLPGLQATVMALNKQVFNGTCLANLAEQKQHGVCVCVLECGMCACAGVHDTQAYRTLRVALTYGQSR